ncbi:MAG: hypothetical protein DMG65_22190 [Candidatus Angelobacter sp. Gp1-AA117]|nr:MAG: hypothetical protein DMG65_22190 [Candidatus Angelobacter sp. Gp1-AA117]
MTAQKKGQAESGDSENSGDSSSAKRKPWIKKDAAESMLTLIGKQEQRVAKMRKELEKEEKQLEKLQKAKKVLEATN